MLITTILLSLCLFMVLTFGAFAAFDNTMNESEFWKKANKILLPVSMILILIFTIWAGNGLHNNQLQNAVQKEIAKAKNAAVLSCLESKFRVKHVLFNIYQDIETGEKVTLSDSTFNKCKSAQ